MWLPILAIVLAALYFWMERSGALARLTRATPRRPAPRKRIAPRRGAGAGGVDRLKVFQEFLEDLPPAEEDADHSSS